MIFSQGKLTFWLLAGFVCLFAADARAIILARTGDPGANITAPVDDIAGSGWNYEGNWGVYSGTPIAPQYFLSAAHIGQADANGHFVFQGVTYTVAASFQDPFSDLLMWEINETFPVYAPLYTKGDEIGQRVVAIGRGTQRGSAYSLNDTFRGWLWGGGDTVRRWGENIATTIVTQDVANTFVYAIFDQAGLTNECHLSAGDSGGALFIDDGGVCKLAGIHYGVDGHFYTDDTGHEQFDAALFDAGDLYEFDGSNYVLLPEPTPTGFYSTRVASKVAWINSIIDPAGTNNPDGIPNLLEYAKVLNGSVPPQNYGAPVFAKTPAAVSLTYRRITGNASLQYLVQQSTNLTSWGPATTQDTVVGSQGNIQTVTSTVSSGAGPLFLRLQVTEQ
jgi:hypothetical protein